MEKQSQSDHESLVLQAETALEKKNLSEAYRIYMDLEMPAHAAFTKVLESKLDEALTLYHKASESPAQKWGVFFCELLVNQKIYYPGYLAFRLYFEPTIWYLIYFNLEKYFLPFEEDREIIEPVYPELMKDIGSAYLAHKNYNQALKFLNLAEHKFPNDVGIHYKKAMAYLGLGESKKAKPLLEKCYTMLPGSPMIKKLLEELSA